MNKFLAGAIDTAFSTLERGVVGWYTLDMEPDEFWAYVFDWNQIGLYFVVGVGLDFLIDGIVDHFRPEIIASRFKGEFADAVGDSVNRELRDSMGDAMENLNAYLVGRLLRKQRREERETSLVSSWMSLTTMNGFTMICLTFREKPLVSMTIS